MLACTSGCLDIGSYKLDRNITFEENNKKNLNHFFLWISLECRFFNHTGSPVGLEDFNLNGFNRPLLF
jgi:hypothetical protein